MKHSYSRIDLACEQLEIAIDLFLSGDSFVSCLTLSGAAEEILGKALEIRSKKNALQYEAGIVMPFHEALYKEALSWKDYISGKNLARNSVKHMDSTDESFVCLDIKEEAYRMLVRACENHLRLGLSPTEGMRRFENWFHENIVGV